MALLRQDVFYVFNNYNKTIKTLCCYWKVQRHRQKVVEARKDVLDVVQVSGVADAYVADEE